MRAEERLAALADAANADFAARLAPGIARESILGVRFPALRKLAKELDRDEAQAFLSRLPHETLDANLLHAVLISGERDYESCLRELDRFLPYVDNWMSCDTLRPAVVRKHAAEFEREITRWLRSDRPYTQRFGIEMLMSYYLGDDFRPEQLALVAAVRSEHYYVRMMQAWYFATALAKQYDSAIPYVEQRRLEEWTHRKTIQKAVESDRIDKETKAYLRTLK